MKKWLCIAMCVLALPVQAADIQAKDLVGKWLCENDYPTINTHTIDAYDFLPDGTSRSTTSIDMKVGASGVNSAEILRYRSHNTGRWTLQNNMLTEIAHTDSVERLHSERVQAALKTSPEFAQLENKLFQTISDNGKSEADRTATVQLIWDDKQPNQFQLHSDELQVTGFCQRVSELGQ